RRPGGPRRRGVRRRDPKHSTEEKPVKTDPDAVVPRAVIPMGSSYCTFRVCSLGWMPAAQVGGCFDQFAAALLYAGVPGDVPVTLRSLVRWDLARVDPVQHGAAVDAEPVAQLADGQFALAGDQTAVVAHAEAGRRGDELAAVGFDGVVEADAP